MHPLASQELSKTFDLEGRLSIETAGSGESIWGQHGSFAFPGFLLWSSILKLGIGRQSKVTFDE